MTLTSFIRHNRAAIDDFIRNALKDGKFKLNDKERKMWILNYEPLYKWVRWIGVKC